MVELQRPAPTHVQEPVPDPTTLPEVAEQRAPAGGGGCGGISASIYVSGANRGDVAIYEETNVLLESGRAGVGGQGGGSTGNPGTPGLDGVVMGLIVQ